MELLFNKKKTVLSPSAKLRSMGLLRIGTKYSKYGLLDDPRHDMSISSLFRRIFEKHYKMLFRFCCSFAKATLTKYTYWAA